MPCGTFSMLCCLATAILLDHRCFQEGRTKGVGGSVEDQHVFKPILAILVSIGSMEPSEVSAMRNPKLENHGMLFFVQGFKCWTRMFKNIASRSSGLWQFERHMWFHLNSFKNFYGSIQFFQFRILKVWETRSSLRYLWSGNHWPQTWRTHMHNWRVRGFTGCLFRSPIDVARCRTLKLLPRKWSQRSLQTRNVCYWEFSIIKGYGHPKLFSANTQMFHGSKGQRTERWQVKSSSRKSSSSSCWSLCAMADDETLADLEGPSNHSSGAAIFELNYIVYWLTLQKSKWIMITFEDTVQAICWRSRSSSKKWKFKLRFVAACVAVLPSFFLSIKTLDATAIPFVARKLWPAQRCQSFGSLSGRLHCQHWQQRL